MQDRRLLVSIKSPERNAPRTSQIQVMVNLNGESFRPDDEG
jgi:hypothetical protein